MKIAVIGFGKMGSWMADELSKEHEIAVFDKDPEKTNRSVPYDILKKVEDVGDFKPDMLINAVNIENTIEAFESVDGIVGSECILCDMATIKKALPEYYERCNHKYASFHPMFGYAISNVGCLKDENAIIIKESDETAKQFFRSLFDRLEIRTFEYSFKEHDEMMIHSLLLPFISSVVFAACSPDKIVPGSTFSKYRAITLGLLNEDKTLLSEILFNNRSLEQVEKATGRFEFLKHIIKARDYEEAATFFAKLRDNII